VIYNTATGEKRLARLPFAGVRGKTPPIDPCELDAELRRQLEAIQNEETPERLLELERELRDLLNRRMDGK